MDDIFHEACCAERDTVPCDPVREMTDPAGPPTDRAGPDLGRVERIDLDLRLPEDPAVGLEEFDDV